MSFPDPVRIVEVGPRDGLQNEPAAVSVEARVALIEALAEAGLASIESGSFVSPRWVPQMAATPEVFARLRRLPGVSYSALAPNLKGLEAAIACGVDEVAIFASASETFSRRNINCSISESLVRLGSVASAALAHSLRVRGYISCVVGCPFEGEIASDAVIHVAEALQAMGCYEVSLGDTIGVGTPLKVRRLLDAISARLPFTPWRSTFTTPGGRRSRTSSLRLRPASPSWIVPFPASVAVPLRRAPRAMSPPKTSSTCSMEWTFTPASIWREWLPRVRRSAAGSGGRPVRKRPSRYHRVRARRPPRSLLMNKVVASSDEAVADIFEGATVMIGGFGICGIPENLVLALVRKGVKGLHTISNNMGIDGFGMGLMLEAGMVASHIGSYVGENRLLESMVISGKLQVTLIPQGTLAECIRAGGAGIPAFYTPTGVGTVVAQGKEVREFDGRSYLLERALTADFALVKAWRGDRLGNLVYRKTARNFNPMMATAARITVAEVERLVEPGEIEPDRVMTPGIYVKRILQGENYERRIERRTLRKAGTPA
jgi:3-oxoacid CoA-transferase subunit A